MALRGEHISESRTMRTQFLLEVNNNQIGNSLIDNWGSEHPDEIDSYKKIIQNVNHSDTALRISDLAAILALIFGGYWTLHTAPVASVCMFTIAAANLALTGC